MTAKDYPVTFGYKEQDGYWYGPNGIIGRYHLGNDRATYIGVPLDIAGEVIGKTGATGETGGPHLHTQAWTGNVLNTQDPTPFEFKPGLVVDVGYASQWGKYITVEVNGVNITYAHLSEVYVETGHVIGGNMDEVQHWKDVAQSRQNSLVAISKEVSVDYKDADNDIQVITNIRSMADRIDELTQAVSEMENDDHLSPEEKLAKIKEILEK